MKHFMVISLPFPPATVWHNLFCAHSWGMPTSRKQVKTTCREKNFNLIHWDSKSLHWSPPQINPEMNPDVDITKSPANQYHLHSLGQILHPPPRRLMINTATKHRVVGYYHVKSHRVGWKIVNNQFLASPSQLYDHLSQIDTNIKIWILTILNKFCFSLATSYDIDDEEEQEPKQLLSGCKRSIFCSLGRRY